MKSINTETMINTILKETCGSEKIKEFSILTKNDSKIKKSLISGRMMALLQSSLQPTLTLCT